MENCVFPEKNRNLEMVLINEGGVLITIPEVEDSCFQILSRLTSVSDFPWALRGRSSLRRNYWGQGLKKYT